MNVLGIPVDLPTRVIGRALSDLGDLARVAREIPSKLDDVQRRLDRALEVAETIDRRMERVLEIGERIDARADAVLELGEQLLEVGTLANERAVLMTEAAREVAVRGAEVAAALPTMERAVAIAQPLEGTVERLGRIVDRLPGSRIVKPADD